MYLLGDRERDEEILGILMDESHEKEFLGRGWAFPIQPDASKEVAMSAYEEDIRQAIWISLGTARGERVMRPDFGAGLHRLVCQLIFTKAAWILQAGPPLILVFALLCFSK